MERRIDRVLDESRRIPKGIGRIAWAMLAGAAGPLIYLAAAVQLAPAQTAMSIPAPAVPAPPTLIAQAGPSPAPPSPAAQAPASEPQSAPAPAASPEVYEFRGADYQYLLGSTEGTLRGPLFVPKIYNSKNKAFFFFQAAQASVAAPGLRISVDRSVPGSATITIRLPDASPEENPDNGLIAALYGSALHEVLNTRVSHAAGVKVIQLPLPPGDYRLKVLVRDNISGQIQTAVTDFHID